METMGIYASSAERGWLHHICQLVSCSWSALEAGLSFTEFWVNRKCLIPCERENRIKISQKKVVWSLPVQVFLWVFWQVPNTGAHNAISKGIVVEFTDLKIIIYSNLRFIWKSDEKNSVEKQITKKSSFSRFHLKHFVHLFFSLMGCEKPC